MTGLSFKFSPRRVNRVIAVGEQWLIKIQQWTNCQFNEVPPRVLGIIALFVCVVSYLLVVSDEDEVLACLAQCGDRVGLKNLSSLFYNHQTWTHVLQNLTELGCACCCHANNLKDSTCAYLTSSASFVICFSMIFIIHSVTTNCFIAASPCQYSIANFTANLMVL